MTVIRSGLVVCMSLLFLTSGAFAGASLDHSDLDTILKQCVRDGRVDYLTIRKSHWERLCGYLDRMGDVEHESLPSDERLALYCNLYNATMIRTIVERYHAGYSGAENNKQVFRDSLVRVKGRTITLSELEHKLIRAGFGEPRIHAALVCGGLGCPRHPAHAYTGPALQQQLEEDMRGWINDPQKNQVDPAAKKVLLSRLFKSYADDFGGVEAVVRFVDDHHPADFTQMKVEFDTNYDWSLNITPPAEGEWIEVVATDPPLLDAPGGKTLRSTFKSAVFEVAGREGEWLKIDRAFGQGFAWIRADQTKPFELK